MTAPRVMVTRAQVAAAKLMIKRAYKRGDHPSAAALAIANASKPKKASNSVSNANLVHARELEITAVTTVSELYEMIDLPYRITKHAKVSIGSKYDFPRNAETPVLRLEWRGDGE